MSKKKKKWLPATISSFFTSTEGRVPKQEPLRLIPGATKVNEEIILAAPPEILADLIAYACSRVPNECGGGGWVTDNNVYHVRDYQLVGLNRSEEYAFLKYDTGEMSSYAVAHGMSTPNMQWHSHPIMTAFWSHTDLLGQEKVLDKQFLFTEGEFFFLVFNGLEFNVRRYWWQDKGKQLWYQDGTISVNDRALRPQRAGLNTGVNDNEYEWLYEDGWWVRSLVEKGDTSNIIPAIDLDKQYYMLIQQDEPVYYLKNRQAELGYILNPDEQRSKYDELFLWLNVPRYRWIELFSKILEVFGDEKYYDLILENPEWWPEIATLIENWELDNAVEIGVEEKGNA